MGTGDLRTLVHLTLHDNSGKHGLPPAEPSPSQGAWVRAAPLQRDQRTRPVFPWEMPHPQTRGSSPGGGFQAGTSLLQVLSCVWGTSCLLVQKVSGEDRGQKGRCRSEHGLEFPDLPGLLLCWVGVITMPASGGAVGLQGMMCLLGWLSCEGGCLREQMLVSDQVATTSRVSEDALCTWSDPDGCARTPGLSPDPGRGCALGTPPGLWAVLRLWREMR